MIKQYFRTDWVSVVDIESASYLQQFDAFCNSKRHCHKICLLHESMEEIWAGGYNIFACNSMCKAPPVSGPPCDRGGDRGKSIELFWPTHNSVPQMSDLSFIRCLPYHKGDQWSGQHMLIQISAFHNKHGTVQVAQVASALLEGVSTTVQGGSVIVKVNQNPNG